MKKICTDCEKEFDPAMSFCLQCGKLLTPSDISADRIVNCNFEYKCPLEWDNLLRTGDSEIRFCKKCEKNVHFAHSQIELDNLSRAGNCVAFHRPDVWITEEIYVQLPENTTEFPPLMGVMIPPDRMAELAARAEAEKEKQQAGTKSWWKFWK